ncbi:blue light receptor [Entophlyctis luteolus]|nr:blue light receptor [Entophlyctis luteolus]
MYVPRTAHPILGLQYETLLRCIHPNDVLSVVKELAQFLLMAKTGSREALAGCAVRFGPKFDCLRKVQTNTPTGVRPFVPQSVLPQSTSDVWSNVEIGFNIAGRNSLLVFVMDGNAPTDCTIGKNPDALQRTEIDHEEIKSLREFMTKQAVGLHQPHAKPHLFLTICDASTLHVLYTSSSANLAFMKAPTNISVDSITNIEHYFGSVTTHRIIQEVKKQTLRNSFMQRMFSLQHPSARSQDMTYESVFIVFNDLLFIITRATDALTDDSIPPSLISGAQQAQQVSPRFPDSVTADEPRFIMHVIPDVNDSICAPAEKRAIRPWEDEDEHLSGGNEQKRFLREMPVLNAPFTAHTISNGPILHNRDQRVIQIQQQQQRTAVKGLQRIPSVASLVDNSRITSQSPLKRIYSDSRLHSRLKYELEQNSMTPLLAAVQYTQQKQGQLQAPGQVSKLASKVQARYSPSHFSVGSGGSESMESSPRQSAMFSGFPQHAFEKPTPIASISAPTTQYPVMPNTAGADATALAAASVLAATTTVRAKSDNDEDEGYGEYAYDDEFDAEGNYASPASGGNAGGGRLVASAARVGGGAFNGFQYSNQAKPRRPLKAGICRKCGVPESREWRRGPHGPKTLCNACGLRFKRKPWDVRDESGINAASNA